jgi:transposase
MLATRHLLLHRLIQTRKGRLLQHRRGSSSGCRNPIRSRPKLQDFQAFPEKRLEQIKQAIIDTITNDAQLSARFDILTSIPGISRVTAFSMRIEMPELGTMSGKQAACLAGLVPISRQSGKWQGKERIQGRRAFFRRAMYMPALCVIRHDLSAKRKYDQLVKAGKPTKAVLTAIMRKLVVVANALPRDGRKWSENCV